MRKGALKVANAIDGFQEISYQFDRGEPDLKSVQGKNHHNLLTCVFLGIGFKSNIGSSPLEDEAILSSASKHIGLIQ